MGLQFRRDPRIITPTIATRVSRFRQVLQRSRPGWPLASGPRRLAYLCVRSNIISLVGADRQCLWMDDACP